MALPSHSRFLIGAGLALLGAGCVETIQVKPEGTRDEPFEAVAGLLSRSKAGDQTGLLPLDRFELLLEQYDQDQDVQLSPVELAGRDFVRFDRDGDGAVTAQDFPSGSSLLTPRAARSLDLKLARRTTRHVFGNQWLATFSKFDSNRDRYLERSEIALELASVTPSSRDPFSAWLDCLESWDDDVVDLLELEQWSE